jgi:hypothetical protein
MSPEQSRNLAEHIELSRELDKLIRQNVPPSKSAIRYIGNGKWELTSRTRRKLKGFVFTYYLQGSEEFRFDEISAFTRLIQLAENGAIDRLAQCHHCEKWFFKKRPHKKYCDFQCQQALVRHSDTYKLKRRDYMREYRAKEEERHRRTQRARIS